VKVVQGQAIEKYRNCFLNLALPVFLFSEPGSAEKTVIKYVLLLFCLAVIGIKSGLWIHLCEKASKFSLQNVTGSHSFCEIMQRRAPKFLLHHLIWKVAI
jgi:hypothetical protein